MTLVFHSRSVILSGDSLSRSFAASFKQFVLFLKEKLNCVHDVEQEKIILQTFCICACNHLILTDNSVEKKDEWGLVKSKNKEGGGKQKGLQTKVPTRGQS